MIPPSAVVEQARRLRASLSDSESRPLAHAAAREAACAALRVYAEGWVPQARGTSEEMDLRFDPRIAGRRFKGVSENALALGAVDADEVESLRRRLEWVSRLPPEHLPGAASHKMVPAGPDPLTDLLLGAANVLRRHVCAGRLSRDSELELGAEGLADLLIEEAGAEGLSRLGDRGRVEVGSHVAGLLARAETHARSGSRRSTQPWTDLFAARADLRDAVLHAVRVAAPLTCVISAEARLAHGMQLLYTTDLPLKTVAARAGYRSAASFSKRFAEQYGLAPTDI